MCFGPVTTNWLLRALLTTKTRTSPSSKKLPSCITDDATMISHLMAAAATMLDRAEAARRRKLPFFGTKQKSRDLDRKMTLERVAAQRTALSAARVGLPRQVLSTKIAPRAFPGKPVSNLQCPAVMIMFNKCCCTAVYNTCTAAVLMLQHLCPCVKPFCFPTYVI